MGMWDYQCMITGISLRAAEATVVALRRTEHGHRPVTLGISGTYDRYGAVDNIDGDLNTRLVAAYFRDHVRYVAAPGPGAAAVAHGWADTEVRSPTATGDIETAISHLAVSTTACSGDTFYGMPVATSPHGTSLVLAFVARPVWDALAGRHPVDGAFDEVFAQAPEAHDIYAGHLPDLAAQADHLRRVDRFLARRGMRWSPPDDSDQFWIDEELALAELAMRTYADVPELVEVLGVEAARLREELAAHES